MLQLEIRNISSYFCVAKHLHVEVVTGMCLALVFNGEHEARLH